MIGFILMVFHKNVIIGLILNLDIFVHFFIGNMPWISQSDNLCPLSKTDDGFMDVQVVFCLISLIRNLVDDARCREYWKMEDFEVV